VARPVVDPVVHGAVQHSHPQCRPGCGGGDDRRGRAYASTRFRWGYALLLAFGLAAFCALLFIKALGLPIPMIGPWFGH